MKTTKELYDSAMADAKQIEIIATKMGLIRDLERQEILIEEKIRPDYEYSQKRAIKNLVSNIYLVLDLHEVKGIADEIFNIEFRPNS